MRIAAAQIAQVFEDPDTAFARAEEFLASTEADMVMFSEQYATGWRASSSTADAEDIKNRWISLAKEYAVCVVGSYQKPASDKPENCMLVCSPEGEVIAEYSKIHLFTPGGEDKAFSAGCSPVTFEYRGVTFGCAICFDLRFPELFREYLKDGVHCILIQAAWAAARAADWELLIRARALENRCYVVGCGSLGYDDMNEVDFAGRSLAADYEGRILEDAGVFEGGFVLDVDSEEMVESVGEMRRKWALV